MTYSIGFNIFNLLIFRYTFVQSELSFWVSISLNLYFTELGALITLYPMISLGVSWTLLLSSYFLTPSPLKTTNSRCEDKGLRRRMPSFSSSLCSTYDISLVFITWSIETYTKKPLGFSFISSIFPPFFLFFESVFRTNKKKFHDSYVVMCFLTASFG